MLLGTSALQTLTDSITITHNGIQSRIKRREREIDACEDEEVLERLREERAKLQKAVVPVDQFRRVVDEQWADPNDRVIGHVRYSPPLLFGVGRAQFTQDWAAIELDACKFGQLRNAVYLGTQDEDDFASAMSPRAVDVFQYPKDRLLPVTGILSEDDLRHPEGRDVHDEPCLMVTKNGSTSGVTIGRATGIKSYLRHRATNQHSSEWAILKHNSTNKDFSEAGDSGSAIVDGLGRIGGLLNGGTGAGGPNAADITYATPMFWLWEKVKRTFPNAQLL